MGISFKLVGEEHGTEGKHDRLWNLSDTQSDFVSMATHQLKTPLSGIKWTLKMLMNGEAGSLTEEQKKWLETSYQSNERVLSLINEMLESIRIDEDELPLNKEEVDIVSLFSEINEHVSPLLLEKNITLDMKVEPEREPIIIAVDKSYMQVTYQNLLENAIRYTRKDGRITISVIKESGDVKVSITDDGIGIPEEEKPSIFRRFYRASNAFKEIEKGSGLGLFIAKGIIEKHGGKIWFESKEGEGTTFYFIIPTS